MSRFSSTAAQRAEILVLAAALLLSAVARCPATSIIELPLPTVGADPESIVFGPDGAYWFVETAAAQIGRVTTNGVVTEYPVNAGACEPIGIVVGPDNNLWFTEFGIDSVASITTNGVVTQFPLPAGVFPTAITLGSDHRLWVLDFGTLDYIPGTPTNGGILALTVSGTNGLTAANYYNSNLTVHSRPGNIAPGPDGSLYFTEQLAGRIGRITTNGAITESPCFPTNCQPWDITTGPDGALWFTEANANKLGWVKAGPAITNALIISNEYLLPVNATTFTADQPGGLIVGPDGNFWYTDPPASCITRVNFPVTNGVTNAATGTQFFTPTALSFPRRLATGADGNIWFGEYVYDYPAVYQNNIGKFIFPAPLNIQFISPNVIVSWTTNITANYLLQTNSDLTTTNWGFATNIPAVVGNQFVVTNTFTNPPGGNLFFRLIN